MTLNEIIVGALQQLRRGNDSQTIDDYRGRFTQYANMAQQDLARDFPVFRTDTVTLTNGAFDVNALPRWCTKLMEIRAGGKPARFDMDNETGKIWVEADGDIEVTYRYLPNPLENPTDSPELPLQLHQCIVSYVVASDKAEGDAATQGSASLYYQVYNEQKRILMRGGMGTPKSYKILHMERW